RICLQIGPDSLSEESRQMGHRFVGTLLRDEMAAVDSDSLHVNRPGLPYFEHPLAAIRAAARAPQREHRRCNSGPGLAIGFVVLAIATDAGAVVLARGMDHLRVAKSLAIRRHRCGGKGVGAPRPS